MLDPWTLYWQADHLDSADAIQSAADYDTIKAWWSDLAQRLDFGAAVLDLATGNGTVPAALLEANPELRITGVDRADIDPLRYLEDPGLLTAVEFQGEVDVCSMSFDDEAFDAVTSQFGIEYAALQDAVPEAARVLRRHGYVQLLLHCDESEIVQPAVARRLEMDELLADDGVLLRLRSFVAGKLSLQELEATGQAHLTSGKERSKGITGQIFTGVNSVIDYVRQGDKRAAAELCETMLLRLGADRDRQRALESAALDQLSFDNLVIDMKAVGVEPEIVEPLQGNVGGGDEFVIGWKYRGRKS
jgi:ubiquinone/menaquinone biosynthesis C-methylase UbiE